MTESSTTSSMSCWRMVVTPLINRLLIDDILLLKTKAKRDIVSRLALASSVLSLLQQTNLKMSLGNEKTGIFR